MTPGERRPREGRCERCDRPLTDEVYDRFQYARANDLGTTLTSLLPEWLPLTSRDGRCQSYTDVIGRPAQNCDGEPIDWRARALQAEARVAAMEARDADAW